MLRGIHRLSVVLAVFTLNVLWPRSATGQATIVPDTCTCSKGSEARFDSVLKWKHGVEGDNPLGRKVEPNTVQGIIGYQRTWVPKNEKRQTLCGRVDFDQRFYIPELFYVDLDVMKEYDWNHHIIPSAPFFHLYQDRPDTVRKKCNRKAKAESDCLEAEITPDKAFRSALPIFRMRDSSDICVYGPHVLDYSHERDLGKVEIHPSELVWWRDSLPAGYFRHVMIALQDASDRFGRGSQMKPKYSDTAAWSPSPQRARFKLALLMHPDSTLNVLTRDEIGPIGHGPPPEGATLHRELVVSHNRKVIGRVIRSEPNFASVRIDSACVRSDKLIQAFLVTHFQLQRPDERGDRGGYFAMSAHVSPGLRLASLPPRPIKGIDVKLDQTTLRKATGRGLVIDQVVQVRTRDASTPLTGTVSGPRGHQSALEFSAPVFEGDSTYLRVARASGVPVDSLARVSVFAAGQTAVINVAGVEAHTTLTQLRPSADPLVGDDITVGVGTFKSLMAAKGVDPETYTTAAYANLPVARVNSWNWTQHTAYKMVGQRDHFDEAPLSEFLNKALRTPSSHASVSTDDILVGVSVHSRGVTPTLEWQFFGPEFRVDPALGASAFERLPANGIRFNAPPNWMATQGALVEVTTRGASGWVDTTTFDLSSVILYDADSARFRERVIGSLARMNNTSPGTLRGWMGQTIQPNRTATRQQLAARELRYSLDYYLQAGFITADNYVDLLWMAREASQKPSAQPQTQRIIP